LACVVLAVLAPLGLQAQTITIDASSGRHPIDPRIYGIAFPDASAISDLRLPVTRWGGNATTRYNWQENASNRASDWFFETIASSSAVAGADADTFIGQAKAGGAAPMLTIPTIGWVGKLGANRATLPGFSIQKYGPQTASDPYFPDAGNGVSQATGQPITGNDPNDANEPADVAFQQGWMQHLAQTWGLSSAGGLKYYLLDNEPSIWHGTHRDVHPIGARMAEIRDDFVNYGAAIKSNDSGALVLGPEEWGWEGYFYSGYDQQWFAQGGSGSPPDRTANGNMDYIPWLLDQMRQHNQATGQRLLDVLSVHYYPQGGEFSNDVSTSMQLLRNRSTRSLWDPNYVDQSWINATVKLVPRLLGWTSTYYPGTQVAITEYNWGAEGHINGATAQADVLGIFGREGLNLGARWTQPATTTPTYKAIKLYRNYDGKGSGFGNVSVSAVAPDPDNLAVFGAERSTGALTIMAVNKVLSGTTAATLQLAHFAPKGTVQVWQLTQANAIKRLPDLGVTGSSVNVSLPAQSITLFVIPGRKS
jgi:hypothetical protein